MAVLGLIRHRTDEILIVFNKSIWKILAHRGDSFSGQLWTYMELRHQVSFNFVEYLLGPK